MNKKEKIKIYVLISNGYRTVYRTQSARNRDYVSQDYETEEYVTKEECNKINFTA